MRNLQLAMSIRERSIISAVTAARGYLQKSHVSTQGESGTIGKAPHILQNLASDAIIRPWHSGHRNLPALLQDSSNSLGGGK